MAKARQVFDSSCGVLFGRGLGSGAIQAFEAEVHSCGEDDCPLNGAVLIHSPVTDHLVIGITLEALRGMLELAESWVPDRG